MVHLKKKIFMMPYAVDNEFFSKKANCCSSAREALRHTLGLQKGRPIILFASKLSERKRPVDLLNAYSRIAHKLNLKPYLLIVGEGEMRPTLEREIKLLKIEDDVQLLGFKNQCELPCYYDLCDVFVLPSLFEPWGLVVNEVMAAGRAIIVSDQVGSGYDLVKHGKNGFVFRAGDIEGLADALYCILMDRNVCRSMGEHSRSIIDQWDFEHDLKGFRQALECVIVCE
jgi:glycosyltransferase involved in cell wall biosynthesis